MKRRSIAWLLSMAFCTTSFGGIVGFNTSIVDNSSQLSGYVTQDLKVTGTGQLTGVQLLLNLSAGSIYQDGFGSEAAPASNFVTLVPSLRYDTFVGLGATTSDSPDFKSTIVAGGAVDLGGAPGMTFGNGVLDIAFAPGGGVVINDPTDFQVARLTLSDDAAGTAIILGATFQEDSLITPELQIVDGALVFPASAGLEGMVGNSGDLSADLQGAFGNRNGGPIMLENAIMLSNSGGELDALGEISSMLNFETGKGEGTATGTVSDDDGDGKFDIMIDAPWSTLPSGFELAGTVSFASANGDPNTFAVPFSINVPEPSTVALSGLALVGLVGLARRRK